MEAMNIDIPVENTTAPVQSWWVQLRVTNFFAWFGGVLGAFLNWFKMVHAKLEITAVFGIIGNVISFGMFASPAPKFYRAIKKNNSVEELKPEYHLLTTMTCLFWVLYGTPFIDPGSILVLTANGIGLVMNLAYLIIFLIYAAADNKQRMYVGGVFLIELAVVGLVGELVIGLAHTVVTRRAFVGGFGYFFSIVMCMPRISKLVKICKEKSVGDMRHPVVVTKILNDFCWIIYASLRSDIFLWFTCCAGFLMGVVEHIVYRIHNKSTSKVGDYEKSAKAGLQLRQIGAGNVHKKLTTDEVQLQKIDSDNKLAAAEMPLEEIVAR